MNASGETCPRAARPGYARGERHPRARVSDAEVELICACYDDGLGYRRLAEKFGLPIRTVRNFVSGARRGSGVQA